jgi:plastocyanin
MLGAGASRGPVWRDTEAAATHQEKLDVKTPTTGVPRLQLVYKQALNVLQKRVLWGALAWLGTGGAWAGPVEVRVSLPGGKPLEGAVVFLEPRDGKPQVLPAQGVEIAQADKRFVPEVTVIPVGTQVNFPNRDTVRHHVYSFSPAKKFEIKLYVGTPASPVLFDQAGIAVIGCNIHDNMAGWIVVVDTPWYGRTGADGRLALPQVPAGRYKLRAWHAGLPVGAAALEQDLRVDAAATQAQVTLQGVRP